MSTSGIVSVPTGPFLGPDGKPSLEWLIWLIQGHVTNTTGTGVGISHSTTVEPTSFSINSTGVTAGTYGDAAHTPVINVNASGQITSLTSDSIAIANTQVSGLGTMSTENSNAVAITGGTITGAAVSALSSLQANGPFGCNSATAQTAYVSGGAVSATGATNTSPYGYTTAAQANGIVTLLNNIRAALVANGIMS